jgi:tetratricopeptide (TPR) repeat protein
MTPRFLLCCLLGVANLAAAPASVWDNPVFQKRLLGSFGFSSEVEPPMSDNERSDYEQILPLIKDAPEQALAYLEKLRALPDSSARFDFLIGNLHFQNNRKPKAAADFVKALEKFPDYRQAHANLAILYAQSGRHKEAVRHFSEAIRLGSADSTQYGLLGISHLELQNFTAAEEAFRMALLLAPDVKDWKTGLVRALYLQERFTEAVALLESMIRETPEDDSLWSLQASAQLGRKDMLAAAANFEVLDRLGKLEAAQLSTLGDIYVNEGLLDAAAGAYLRAHVKTGGDIGVPLRAAEVLLAKQGYQAAREMLQKLGEGDRELSASDRLRVLKLEARIGMAEGREAAAAELLARVAEQDPLDGETLLLLGGHHQKEGRPEKAAFYYETAGNIEAFEADAKVRLAQLYAGSGKYAEAIPLLKRAQELKPRDSVGKFLEDLERFLKSRR